MKPLWLLKLFLILLTLVLIDTTPLSAADSRITHLYCEEHAVPGNPAISDYLIVWSEYYNVKVHPCYFNINEEHTGIMNNNVKLANAEKIRIDDGLATYRDITWNELWGTNLGEKERLGLSKHESRRLINNEMTIARYDITGDKMAYFELNSSCGNMYFITAGGEVHKSVYSVNVTSLKLTAWEENTYALWINNNEELYCYEFSGQPYKINNVSIKNGTWLNTWGNRVVYIDTTNNLQLLDLNTKEISSLPTYIKTPICIYEDSIYFYEKDEAYDPALGYITMYNLNTGAKQKLVQTEKPKNLDSNGSDLIWKNSDRKIMWRAGLEKITVEPHHITLKSGSNTTFQATAEYKNGYTEEVTEKISWVSSDETIAFVKGNLITAVKPGTAVLTGQYEGQSLEIKVLVKDLQFLKIEPADDIILETGETFTFTVTGYYSDGSSKDVTTEVIWSCSGNNTITPTGEFTAADPGTAEILASLEGITAAKNITIKEPVVLASLQINPGEDVVLKTGETFTFTATGYYSDGSSKDVTTEVIWVCSGNNTITPTGEFTAADPGTAEIEASLEGIIAGKTIIIKELVTLTTLKIEPADDIILETGETFTFTATGYYSDGSSKDVTIEVIWVCSGNNTITPTGEFTAAESGTAEIEASLEGITTGKTIIIKEPVTLTTLKINPAEDIVLETGETFTFTATGYYSDGSSKDVTAEVIWSCSGNNTITPTGEFTATEPGTAEITATLDITAVKTLTVSTPPEPSRSKRSQEINLPETNPLYLALQNASPDQKIVNINLELLDGKLKFMLDKKILDLMKDKNKNLQITSSSAAIIIEPNFVDMEGAESIIIELEYLSQNSEKEYQDKNRILRPLSGLYTLTVLNDRGKPVKHFNGLTLLIPFEEHKTALPPVNIYQLIPADNRWEYRHSQIRQDNTITAEIFAPGRLILMENHLTFDDIQNHWAREDIEFIASYCLMQEVNLKNYVPDAVITGKEFAELLTRLLPELMEQNPVLNEFPAADKPTLSREQTAVLICTILKNSSLSIYTSSKNLSATYTDKNKISPQALEDITTLSSLGILKGMKTGEFNPHKDLTRAESAALLKRIWHLLHQ